MGTLPPLTRIMLTPKLLEALVHTLVKNGWLAKQGAYAVVQTPAAEGTDGFAALRGALPAFNEFVERVMGDIARAVGVAVPAVYPRFAKVVTPSTVVCTGAHKLHKDVDSPQLLRVVVTINGVAADTEPQLVDFFAGAGNSAAEARRNLTTVRLGHCDIHAQVPALGYHGAGPVPAYHIRMALVFDVCIKGLCGGNGIVPSMPVAVPGDMPPLPPVTVPRNTVEELRVALVAAPQSRDAAKNSWLAWVKARKGIYLKGLRKGGCP